jgi:peptidoglycan/xylan/chitin deacetylase (PgdA/CDA1 family)
MGMSGPRRWVRAAAGAPALNAALRRIAAARGRSLILLYHRVGNPHGSAPAVVPWVPTDLFRRQIEALTEAGDVVPLTRLLEPARSQRPRFALTFDDDYRNHANVVAPLLQRLGVPATFFLSGRALSGLGRYWWEILEDLVAREGAVAVARMLGRPPAPVQDLALACERDPGLQELLGGEDTVPSPAHLDADQLRQLARPPFTFGFHTLHHPVMTELDDDLLRTALDEGRARLSEHVGAPLELFAYPHGKADARTATAVRAAGYAAAFTGRPHATGRTGDRYLLGRWEVGDAAVDQMLIGAATRINRPIRTSP